MYDIHCHILPDFDDGSSSLTDSIKMAEVAVKTGTKGIIATPHGNIPGMFENFCPGAIIEKVRMLNDELRSRNIPLEIYPGQEVYSYGDILSLLNENKLITLNNSRYILVEFDFGTEEKDVYTGVKHLISAGLVPIIAHPERYSFTYNNPDAIFSLKSTGALLQLNALSISGRFGCYPKQVSRFILENSLADFVASDAHNQYSRTPDLFDAYEIVCAYFSYEYANQIFKINPLNVIKNIEIR